LRTAQTQRRFAPRLQELVVDAIVANEAAAVGVALRDVVDQEDLLD